LERFCSHSNDRRRPWSMVVQQYFAWSQSIATIGETRPRVKRLQASKRARRRWKQRKEYRVWLRAYSAKLKNSLSCTCAGCRYRSRGDPGAPTGHKCSTPCDVTGYSLVIWPTRIACPCATQLKHFFRQWLYTRHSPVATLGAVPLGPTGTCQGAFRSGTIVTTTMRWFTIAL